MSIMEGLFVNIVKSNGLNAKTGDITTRGIGVKDQYIDSPALVTLNISGSTFATTKKAAVLVTSVTGATINWGDGNDISGVATDKVNAVWNDAERTAAWDLVTVTGCTKVQEKQ